MPTPFPKPFPCPACGSVEVLLHADVFVWAVGQQPARGYDWQLADNSNWTCADCGADGPVDSSGPVIPPASPATP